MVPYDRLKEVIDQRNAYKELLESRNQTNVSDAEIASQAKAISDSTGESYEDAVKVVKQIVQEQVSDKLAGINRQLELDRAMRDNPDFLQYKDQIKEVLKENPNLNWSQAYKLAKFPFLASKAEEVSNKEIQNNISEKQNAAVESAAKNRQPITDAGQIDPLAKGPDGKFLYSTKELEEMLPRK